MGQGVPVFLYKPLCLPSGMDVMWLFCAFTCLSVSADALNFNPSQDNQICGEELNLTKDTPTSIVFQETYSPGLQCSWSLVVDPLACGLTLDLGDLLLPPCPSDLLEVGETQLCGDLPRMLRLPIHSPQTNITLRGNLGRRQGFNITVRQTKCEKQLTDTQTSMRLENLENFSCGGEFFGDNFVIESPGYPSSYPPEVYCLYTIRRLSEDVCKVEITFENSSIEVSEACYKDRLEIQGDRICGELKGDRTYGIDSALDIRFVSDSKGSGKGFKLLGKQIKCSDTPIIVEALEENDKQDVLVECGPQGAPIFPPNVGDGYPKTSRPFPPFPLPGRNYPPSQSYPPQSTFPGNPLVQRVPTGVFSPQSSSQFPSSFSFFNKIVPQQGYFPPGGLASPPYREKFPQSPKLPGFYNSIPPPTLQRPFITQFPQSQQCCGRIYTDSHFLIVSPGFPRSQSSDCIFTIQRYSPLTFQLRFQFRYFWVGQDRGDGCSGGALEIDGNRICGCKTGIIWTSQYFDAESVKVLHLRLDSSIDKLFNGFVIEVYQDDSYSGRYKRGETNPNVEEFTLSNGKSVNFTQYIETVVEREPLITNNENQVVSGTNSQLVWDPNQQTWTLPTDFFCLRWSFQDWLLLAKETLWSQYQCPVSAPSSFSTEDSTRFDITACRTCNYFCRQNCQCC